MARAQSAARVEGGPWRPELSLDPNALPYVEGTLVPGHGNWNVQAVVEYARDPVVLVGATGRVPYARDQLWLTAGAQVGLGTRWALGFQVPVLLYQASEVGATGLPPADLAALGDPRLLLRWTTRPERSPLAVGTSALQGAQHVQNQREQREGFGFALNLALTAPLGAPGSLASWGAPTAHLFGTVDFRLFRIVGALSLGYRLRFDGRWPSQAGTCVDATSPVCLFDVPQRDHFTWGVAVRQPLEGLLALIFLGVSPRLASASILAGNWVTTYATLQGAVDARAPFAMAATTPLELGVGLQSSALGEFTLSVGASWGLTAAPGSAAVRAIASLQWAPRFVDEDHDGLRDDPAIDQCIGLPEDFDRFEDHDGCPEDNDHDAIPDEEDRCPLVDEDEDGFEDDDGCPDPDNDGDEVPDAEDACPNEAQGDHPDTGRRGCPHPDRDGDAVPNTEDTCPDEARGTTPDPDRPGCPAPDRDRDGVPDATDACPDETADTQVPALRGCPDRDTDRDGVPNTTDQCADAQETINGVRDDDGCPEVPPRPGLPVPGALPRVRVLRTGPNDAGTIVLNEPVRFGPDDRVLAASNPLLAQLAVALRATARWPERWWQLTVPTSPPGVPAALAVTPERARRRRDAVIAALRALGVDERVLQPADPAPPLRPGTPSHGVLLIVQQEGR
jgi:hypothetical protein